MLLRPRTWLPRTRFLMASTLAFTIGVSLSHCGNTVIGDDVNADAGTDQPKQLVSLTVSPDNAVFEILDELREHVWASYGLQIQQLLRGERGTAVPAADDIDEADVPF